MTLTRSPPTTRQNSQTQQSTTSDSGSTVTVKNAVDSSTGNATNSPVPPTKIRVQEQFKPTHRLRMPQPTLDFEYTIPAGEPVCAQISTESSSLIDIITEDGYIAKILVANIPRTLLDLSKQNNDAQADDDGLEIDKPRTNDLNVRGQNKARYNDFKKIDSSVQLLRMSLENSQNDTDRKYSYLDDKISRVQNETSGKIDHLSESLDDFGKQLINKMQGLLEDFPITQPERNDRSRDRTHIADDRDSRERRSFTPFGSSTRYSLGEPRLTAHLHDTSTLNTSAIDSHKFKFNQRVMTNHNKIPRYDASKESVTMFLCSRIADHAKINCVDKAELISEWVHMCFKEANQKRVRRNAHDIYARNTDITAKDFLIELARSLDFENSDALSEQTKKRKHTQNEGLEDYVIRMQIELQGIRMPANEINKKIIQYAMHYEPVESIKLEIKRSFQSFLTGNSPITDTMLFDRAKLVDQLAGCGKIGSLTKLEDPEISRVSAISQKHLKSEASKGIICKECDRRHFELLPDNSGTYYTHCRNCFLKIFQDDNRLYSTRYNRESGKAEYWSEHDNSYQAYPREFLYPVHQDYISYGRRGRDKFSYPAKFIKPKGIQNTMFERARQMSTHQVMGNYQNRNNSQRSSFGNNNNRFHVKNWNQVQRRRQDRFDRNGKGEPSNRWQNDRQKPMQNKKQRSNSFAKINSVCVPKDISNFMTRPSNIRSVDKRRKRYRIIADCKLENQSTKGLIDSGSCDNLVSVQLLERLGIHHMIDRSRCKYVSGFDGTISKTRGSIDNLNIDVGNFRYDGNFTVVEDLSTYDLLLGVPFLEDTGIYADLKTSITNTCGQQAIGLGN